MTKASLLETLDLSSAAQDFVRALNKSPKLFNQTPKHIFQPSVMWPHFHASVKKPFVVYVCRPGLTGLDFHIERTEALALGYLHFLHSSNLHVGYVFEVEGNSVIDYNQNYLLVHKKDITFDNKINPEVPLTNQHVTVYSYAEALILAVRKKFVYNVTKP